MEYRILEKQILEFFTSSEKLLKVIGYSDEVHYNFLMKQIYNTMQQLPNIQLFTNGFPIPTNTAIIKAVQKAVYTMNLNELIKEDISLTNDLNLNQKIKNAFVTVLQSRLKEPFKNNNIKMNFFIKQVVTTYEFLEKFKMTVSSNEQPILVYYGNVSEDDLYQLQILYMLDVKILYIHSFQDIQIGVGETVILETISPIIDFMKRIQLSVKELPDNTQTEDNGITTWAGTAKEELYETLYNNDSYIRPWQFKKYTTKDLTFRAVKEDIDTYWSEDAKLRPEFKVENHFVHIPHFLTKINGTFTDLGNYYQWIKDLKETELTLFKSEIEFLPITYSVQEMYSLGFIFNPTTKEIQEQKLRENKLYQLQKVNTDVQHFIFLKLNEFVQKYKTYLQDKEIVELIVTVITLPEEWIRLIENFDFAYKVPKIIFYLYDRTNFDLKHALFIKFLALMGFDILLFSPIGTDSLENYCYGKETLNQIILDDIKFDLTFEELSQYKTTTKKKKRFFDKLFG